MQTFVGKLNVEGLHKMDGTINTWLAEHGARPVHILQSCGTDRHRDGREEPIVVITIWYEGEERPRI